MLSLVRLCVLKTDEICLDPNMDGATDIHRAVLNVNQQWFAMPRDDST
jgi:hypothetical protein